MVHRDTLEGVTERLMVTPRGQNGYPNLSNHTVHTLLSHAYRLAVRLPGPHATNGAGASGWLPAPTPRRGGPQPCHHKNHVSRSDHPTQSQPVAPSPRAHRKRNLFAPVRDHPKPHRPRRPSLHSPRAGWITWEERGSADVRSISHAGHHGHGCHHHRRVLPVMFPPPAVRPGPKHKL